VQLSFNNAYGGRDQVLANLAKLGMPYVKKTCSMALGDQGITVLDHVSGYATLANDGKRTKGYAITEIRNGKDEVIYSRERDEPPAPQIFDRKAVETLNSMLGHVVSEGTGRAAQLDFTTAVGKTGTSSDYKDAWFLGFTGQYVTGVWMGNDNFTSTGRVTGGSLPAQTWHAYNVAAHTSYNIPQIPGLPLHPRQAEELARIAELRKADPTMGAITDKPGSGGSRIPARTRKVLSALAKSFKDARKLDEAAAKGASLGTGGGAQIASGPGR
jgi:penicillin-binding protein 1A